MKAVPSNIVYMLAVILLLFVPAAAFPMAYSQQQDMLSPTTSSSVSSCNFNANGTMAITVWSFVIQVWRKAASGHFSLFQAISLNASAYFGDFNRDASRIAAGGSSFLDVYSYNTSSGMYEWRQRLGAESTIASSITEIVFSADGNRMVASCLDFSLIAWKYNSGTQLYIFSQKLLGHMSAVFSLSTRDTADTVVSASGDSSVRVWKYDNVSGLYTLNQTILTGSPVSEVDLSPDQLLIVSSQSQRTLLIWKRPNNTAPFTLQQTLSGHTAIVYVSKFNSDQSQIASVSADQSLKIWKLQSDGTYSFNQSIFGSFIYLNFDPSNLLLVNQAVFWNPDKALLYSLALDCSKIDNSNGAAAIQNQCTCNSPFLWDSAKGCSIDCTKVANAFATALDQYNCACDSDYTWSSTTLSCSKKSPTVIIASAVSSVLALVIIGFAVVRYYRFKMQRVHVIQAQLNQFQLSNDAFKSTPATVVDEPCSVCLEMSTNVISSCRHVFHKACLVVWLQKMESCPNCRASDFSVMIRCRKCQAYVQPRGFCQGGCRHRHPLTCLRQSVFDECIECRYNQQE